MEKSSRHITTNQIGIHQNLHKVVSRHLLIPSQKPIAEHTAVAFQSFLDWLQGWTGELILDSCCGVGESTSTIAKAHPNARVVGIDKSAVRLDKHAMYNRQLDNYLVLRADLIDFMRLLVLEGKTLSKHFMLYPNPYPKSAHLQRRWYATSALADMLKLGGMLEVRSNWQLYIQEFSEALKIAQIDSQVQTFKNDKPITPFERKYWHSGQNSWQLLAQL